jgi:hypothetical protein
MGAAADDDTDAELTREDKLRLKALLRLLDKAVSGAVDTPTKSGARPLAKATDEDIAEYRAICRRKAHRHG